MNSLPIRVLFLTFLILAVSGDAVNAQEIAISFGEGTSVAGRSIQLIVLLTILSVVPGLAIMITCFPFIVTVLSILRQAIGLQQSPPNMLIVSLAMFLTYFVMQPVFEEAWETGLDPLVAEELELKDAVENMLSPFKMFMMSRTDPETLQSLIDLRESTVSGSTEAEEQLSILIPSFLISEVTKAFQIGFIVFLPFLIIDLVVAAILMSMGMMMVPPAIVSLPFKLAFFVVADGWTLISTALVGSYF